ncbi:hypothetical protein CIHG_02975 [Coccidioides immitis H538.4]|uniref:Uncharacterized protein n=1 Tax=Coccidioides immitis H538.4 TaxID=396776 RepID=A0A0J8RK51_COCIT|nr:hypothetical protein CIHG_02975 [Coccidioides immitis H538.4]
MVDPSELCLASETIKALLLVAGSIVLRDLGFPPISKQTLCASPKQLSRIASHLGTEGYEPNQLALERRPAKYTRDVVSTPPSQGDNSMFNERIAPCRVLKCREASLHASTRQEDSSPSRENKCSFLARLMMRMCAPRNAMIAELSWPRRNAKRLRSRAESQPSLCG